MRNQRSKWDAFLEALLPGETPVTFLMMLFCVATYLLGALQTHLLWESDGAALLRMGANFGPQTMAGGEWWRLATYAFLHGGIIHVAFNMMALKNLGPLVEMRLGSARFGAVYAVASVTGGIGSLVSGTALSVGASGAVTGLIGAGIIIGHLTPGAMAKNIRDQLLFWLGINLLIGFMPGSGLNIDNGAHIGGLLGGAGLGWLFLTLEHRAPGFARAARIPLGLLPVAMVVALGWQFYQMRNVAPIRGGAAALGEAGEEALMRSCFEELEAERWSEAERPCGTWRYAVPDRTIPYLIMAALYEQLDQPGRAGRERNLIVALAPDAADMADLNLTPPERIKVYLAASR